MREEAKESVELEEFMGGEGGGGKGWPSEPARRQARRGSQTTQVELIVPQATHVDWGILAHARSDQGHAAAQLKPSMALRRLEIIQRDSSHSEASFAFGGKKPRGLAPLGPRARIPGILHRPTTHEDALDPQASDEEHNAFDDTTREVGRISLLTRMEEARSISPLVRNINPLARSTSPVARSVSPVARQAPRSPTFVGTSERRAVLAALQSRLTPAPLPRSSFAKNGGDSWGKVRAGTKARALKKEGHGVVFAPLA
ncbi:hypothetical protein T484DRAFT_1849104 [Baffinella frigidus]|nr:hypothetical protein T484DRAFT_1849104 [Cryptophyta sp. CCMP2293]